MGAGISGKSKVMPTLNKILIFPIKSLDGVFVNNTRITSGGSLEMDREFAIFDQQGKIVNAKQNAKIHQVRSQFDLSQRQVTLSVQGLNSQSFSLDHEQAKINHWLGNCLGFPVTLQQDQNTGFPDDPQSPGPTIISQASLETVASWFPGLSVESMRSRFRTNLEFSDTEPFWEDILYSEPKQNQPFYLGSIAIFGINPCQRCIVPTRDQQTGEQMPQFQRIIRDRRRESLPDWADATVFNHYYRLAVNTRIPTSEAGRTLNVGDIYRPAQ